MTTFPMQALLQSLPVTSPLPGFSNLWLRILRVLQVGWPQLLSTPSVAFLLLLLFSQQLGLAHTHVAWCNMRYVLHRRSVPTAAAMSWWSMCQRRSRTR